MTRPTSVGELPGPLRADAVVVGGGIVGAAIAHHLAATGFGSVVLCEQGQVPGQGATTRSGGLLRLHHTAHADTRLAARSLPVFEHWADLIGGDCGYRRTGFLMLVGEKYAAHLDANVAAVLAAGGRSERLDLPEVLALYPGLDLDGVGAAAYEPEGGYADPAAATRSLTAAARALGVTVGNGVQVRRLLVERGRVAGAETNVGRLEAPVVVLAGGAWAGELAREAGVDVPVAARRIGLALARLPGAGRWGSEHSLPTCIDDTTGSYFRPDGPDRFYFGVPSHPDVRLGLEVEPLTPQELTSARAAVARRAPAAAGAPLIGTRAGFDGYTPDRRPVIGPAGPDGLYLAVGFSGGGFKTAPAVAELAVAEITAGGAVAGRAGEPLLQPYRLERFAAERPIIPEAGYERM